MGKDFTLLKREIAELLVHGNRFVSLAKEAKAEAPKLPDRSVYEGAAYWADLVAENVSGGIRKVSQAAEERKPKDLAHAVGDFLPLGRYVNDYDYKWFSKHEDMNSIVGKICELAGSIYRMIDVFDLDNIESVKRALK